MITAGFGEGKTAKGVELRQAMLDGEFDICTERGIGVVLGAMLIDKDAVTEVAEILKPDDFYRGHHGTIYAAALEHPEDVAPQFHVF